MAKNKGKVLVDAGPETTSNGVQLSKALLNRPEDFPVLSGSVMIEAHKFPDVLRINRERAAIWRYIREVLWQKFKWTPDTVNSGQIDKWRSLYMNYVVGTERIIEGDCEDLALTAIEFAIQSGIEPRHLYLVQCLTTAGQSINKRVPKGERKALDHVVALLVDDDGTQWLIDSSEKRQIETVEECRLEFYNWHRMDWPITQWPEISWRRCEVVDK